MNILFTICGRAGSKGFKNKNLKEMEGVPLVYYTIAAINSFIKRHREHKVIVALNTDSAPLVDLINNQEAINVRYINRKDELAGDTVPKIDVIRDTYLSVAELDFDVIVDLDITSPLRRVEDIENVLLEYVSRCYDVVFSVVEARRSPYFNMVEMKEDGYYRKICKSKYTARQQAPKTFEMNASIYAYNPIFLKDKAEKTILDYNCGISLMPDYLVLDIDSEEDFRMMNSLYCVFREMDPGLITIFEEAQSICEGRS